MDRNRCASSAHVVRHADLRAFYLAFAGLAPELLDDLVDLLDAGCSDRVTAGFESAARVDRDLPAKGCLAVSGELAGRTLLAEAEILDGADLRDREAVVYLDHVDVLMRKVRHLEGTVPCGDRCVERRDVAPVVQCDRVACLSTREHLDRRVRELAGPVER